MVPSSDTMMTLYQLMRPAEDYAKRAKKHIYVWHADLWLEHAITSFIPNVIVRYMRMLHLPVLMDANVLARALLKDTYNIRYNNIAK
jgi:hypothetical protein